MRRSTATVGPLLISAGLVALLGAALRWPPIGDLTTTPERPPRFRVDPPGDVPYPDRYTELQQRAYADLVPLETELDVPAAFARAADVAEEMAGWTVVLRDDAAAVLQAEVETPVIRFRDDVVVEVRPDDGGSAVHVRSRSRVGRMDFGTNARRIRAYLDRLG